MNEWPEYQRWLAEERDFELTDESLRRSHGEVAGGRPEPRVVGEPGRPVRMPDAGGRRVVSPTPADRGLTFTFPGTVRGAFVLWQNKADCHAGEVAVALDADGTRLCHWCVHGPDAA